MMVRMGGDIKRILVTGAMGQIGSELVEELQKTYGINNILACLAGQGVWTGTQNWPQNRIDAINECYRKQMDRIDEALKAEPNCDIANYYCPDTTLVPDYSNVDSYNYRGQMEKTMLDRGFDTVYSIGKNDPIFLEFRKKEKQLRGLLN